MLQNTLLDQSLDQVSEQEPLVLVAWDQDGQVEADAAGPASLCRRPLDLYAVAVFLLLLLSFAAILVCFARLN